MCGGGVYLRQVVVVCGVLQVELVALLRRQAGQHAVEDVVVTLVTSLADDACLLQQVLIDLGALYCTLLVEMNVDVLAETARVVVSDGLRVPESLKSIECITKLNMFI